MATYTINKHRDNHTLSIQSADGYFLYITFLVSQAGAPKGYREYRITHADGLVKYMSIDEFQGTALQAFIKQVLSLTKRVKDNKIFLLQDGTLYVKK